MIAAKSDERSRSAIEAAKGRRTKTIQLKMPYDDILIPNFVDVYDEAYREKLENYTDALVEECGIRIDGGFPSMDKPEWLDRNIEPFGFEEKYVNDCWQPAKVGHFR